MIYTIFSKKNLQNVLKGSAQPILSHMEDLEPFEGGPRWTIIVIRNSKSLPLQTPNDD